MNAYLRTPDRNVCLRWLRENVPQVVGVIDTSGLVRGPEEMPERDDDEPDYDAERPLTPMENYERNYRHNVR